MTKIFHAKDQNFTSKTVNRMTRTLLQDILRKTLSIHMPKLLQEIEAQIGDGPEKTSIFFSNRKKRTFPKQHFFFS